MKDPARWISDSSRTADKRELLRHGLRMDPPRRTQTKVWAALVRRIGAMAVAQAGGSAAHATVVGRPRRSPSRRFPQ